MSLVKSRSPFTPIMRRTQRRFSQDIGADHNCLDTFPTPGMSCCYAAWTESRGQTTPCEKYSKTCRCDCGSFSPRLASLSLCSRSRMLTTLSSQGEILKDCSVTAAEMASLFFCHAPGQIHHTDNMLRRKETLEKLAVVLPRLVLSGLNIPPVDPGLELSLGSSRESPCRFCRRGRDLWAHRN
jgi:hypothetical protein